VAQQELQAKQMEGELGTQTEEQAELEAAVQSEGMGALFRMGKLETENTMRKVTTPPPFQRSVDSTPSHGGIDLSSYIAFAM
jgi:hypothetical protein